MLTMRTLPQGTISMLGKISKDSLEIGLSGKVEGN